MTENNCRERQLQTMDTKCVFCSVLGLTNATGACVHHLLSFLELN